jgi:hypothetical protein
MGPPSGLDDRGQAEGKAAWEPEQIQGERLRILRSRMTPQQSRDAKYRFQLTFWLVFIVWTSMYFVVLHVVRPADATPDPTFVNTALIISALLVAASVVVKYYGKRRAAITGGEVSWRVSFMLALMFCEMAALFGVAVWGATGSSKAYWFLVLGLAGMLYHIPRRAE